MNENPFIPPQSTQKDDRKADRHLAKLLWVAKLRRYAGWCLIAQLVLFVVSIIVSPLIKVPDLLYIGWNRDYVLSITRDIAREAFLLMTPFSIFIAALLATNLLNGVWGVVLGTASIFPFASPIVLAALHYRARSALGANGISVPLIRTPVSSVRAEIARRRFADET